MAPIRLEDLSAILADRLAKAIQRFNVDIFPVFQNPPDESASEKVATADFQIWRKVIAVPLGVGGDVHVSVSTRPNVELRTLDIIRKTRQKDLFHVGVPGYEIIGRRHGDRFRGLAYLKDVLGIRRNDEVWVRLIFSPKVDDFRQLEHAPSGVFDHGDFFFVRRGSLVENLDGALPFVRRVPSLQNLVIGFQLVVFPTGRLVLDDEVMPRIPVAFRIEEIAAKVHVAHLGPRVQKTEFRIVYVYLPVS